MWPALRDRRKGSLRKVTSLNCCSESLCMNGEIMFGVYV